MKNIYCLYDKKLMIGNDPFVASDLQEAKQMVYNFVVHNYSLFGVSYVKKLIEDLSIVYLGKFDSGLVHIFPGDELEDYDPEKEEFKGCSLAFLLDFMDRFDELVHEQPMILNEEDPVNEEIS